MSISYYNHSTHNTNNNTAFFSPLNRNEEKGYKIYEAATILFSDEISELGFSREEWFYSSQYQSDIKESFDFINDILFPEETFSFDQVEDEDITEETEETEESETSSLTPLTSEEKEETDLRLQAILASEYQHDKNYGKFQQKSNRTPYSNPLDNDHL